MRSETLPSDTLAKLPTTVSTFLFEASMVARNAIPEHVSDYGIFISITSAQGGNAGACGNVNSDSSYIVAVNSGMFDSSKCGQSVTVTNQNNGQSITATVADLCPGCGGTS